MDDQLRQLRPQGFDVPGHAHELTFSCDHRFPFLSKDRTCEWLAKAIHKARTTLHDSLWADVFMPEHVHLIIHPQEKIDNYSDFLKAVKEPVSRKAVPDLKPRSPGW